MQVSNFLYNKFIDLTEMQLSLNRDGKELQAWEGEYISKWKWVGSFFSSLLQNPLALIYLAVSKPSYEHCFIYNHHYCCCCSILPRWFSENLIIFFFTFPYCCKTKNNKSQKWHLCWCNIFAVYIRYMKGDIYSYRLVFIWNAEQSILISWNMS